MRRSFAQLDEILRGDATQLASLKDGEIKLPLGGLVGVMIILGAVYGACMGSFNLLHPLDEGAAITARDAWMQTFASAVKLPLLFFLTLLVTFPSLYVFNALVGSRLKLLSVLKLLVASIAVMLTVVASLGPIVVFFSLCTTSYPFMQLLNVATSTVAGVLGLSFLLRTLHRLVLIQENNSIIAAATPSSEGGEAVRLSALEAVGQTSRKARNVFQIWTLVFSLVGAQMSWVLRPFIGNPMLGFEWFRARESNFFLAVLQALQKLFTS
jgi:hypothetical protein